MELAPGTDIAAEAKNANEKYHMYEKLITYLYLNLDPKERKLLLFCGGVCSRKKVWCSTHDFHRFLQDL